MRIVRASDSRVHEGGPAFLAHEYDTHDPALNIARVEIHGRVPEAGKMRNTKVKEVVYVESGDGTFTAEGSTHTIAAGDVISYEPFEEVVWEGHLVLIIACTPAWSPEQHEIVP